MERPEFGGRTPEALVLLLRERLYQVQLLVGQARELLEGGGDARAFGRALGFLDAIGGMACRVCGCTEGLACELGCGWVEPELCSSCADGPARVVVIDRDGATVLELDSEVTSGK